MEMRLRRSPVFVKRFMRKAAPATAVVQYLLRNSGDDGGELWDNVMGELEVTGPDGATYAVRGIWNGFAIVCFLVMLAYGLA